jgi:hypothetical protein
VPGGSIARGFFVVAWIVVLALYLSHSIVLSSDSVNNHVHVWYIARDLWHHGRLPWRFPQLAHGEAYAYPYGFLNWTTAALLWPLFGNWAVTLWTAVGVVGCIVATFVAFPELREGWWAAAALANPAIIEALLFGQQSFAWAAMLLLFGMAAWRRGHPAWAAVLVGIGQATHPAIVGPIALVVVLLVLPFEHRRRALIGWYALACLIAIPGVALALATPTQGDIGFGPKIVDFLDTLGPRVLIAVLPIFYVLLRRVGWGWLGPFALVVSLGFGFGLAYPLNVGAQWSALVHHGADTRELDAYLHSPQFVPGATYRVLRGYDAKLGMYHVLQAGGSLDSEMFPESMAIKNFKSQAEYEQLLCDRKIDQVLAFDSYTRSRRTNEIAVLEAVANGEGPVRVRELARGTDWRAWAVDRSGCANVHSDSQVTRREAPFRAEPRLP